jgi:hypothetical protein
VNIVEMPRPEPLRAHGRTIEIDRQVLVGLLDLLVGLIADKPLGADDLLYSTTARLAMCIVDLLHERRSET